MMAWRRNPPVFTMSEEIEFEFIGWCNNPAENHDKLWTSFKVDNVYYAGWGKRGKKLSFKKHGTGFSGEYLVNRVKRKKAAPVGEYQEVDAFQLFSLFPTFKEDVSKFLMFDLLSNKVK